MGTAFAILLQGGAPTAHAIDFLLAAIYVGFWLSVPRKWSVALAGLTVPPAFVATFSAGAPPALWLYPAIALGFVAPEKFSWAALIAVSGLAIFSSFISGNDPLQHKALYIAVPVLLAGLTGVTVRRLLNANEELARTRLQLAVAAVQEERARFARDLHDLLGHSLTVLVAKIRLARRLPTTGADAELADAEHIALNALDEVRQAVDGYRGPTLDSQISGARAALEAAGIALEVSGSAKPIAAGAEGALAFSIREGVTNVLRHSGASSCWVTVGRDERMAWVEVRDDGKGGAGGGGGSGLEGLRERTTRLGGTLVYGPSPDGGFRLRVTVPADAEFEEPTLA